MPKSVAMFEDEISPSPVHKLYVIEATADYDQELGFRGNSAVGNLKMFHTDTVPESLQPEGYCRQLAENGKSQTVGSYGRTALIFGSKGAAYCTGLLMELAKMCFFSVCWIRFSSISGEASFL